MDTNHLHGFGHRDWICSFDDFPELVLKDSRISFPRNVCLLLANESDSITERQSTLVILLFAEKLKIQSETAPRFVSAARRFILY
jgi:hypothetical protein